MRYTAFIVEDEEHSRKRMRRLLAEYPDDIEVLGEAQNGLEAVERIRALDPQLLFLDINLPGMDGFQLLANLEKKPIVIFTTASNQHALEAFKTNAVDYLLKPIDGEELKRAVEKLKTLGFSRGDSTKVLEKLAASLGSSQYLKRILCKVGDRLVIVKTSDILYFNSDSKYTSVMTTGKQYLIDTSLVALEGKLAPNEFIRIHRSTIVNVSWIGELRRDSEGRLKVVLLDKQGTELGVSKNHVEGTLNAI